MGRWAAHYHRLHRANEDTRIGSNSRRAQQKIAAREQREGEIEQDIPQKQMPLKTDEVPDKMRSGAISGALNPLGKRAEAHAAQYYDCVRKMTTDIKRIAESAGYPEEQIQRRNRY